MAGEHPSRPSPPTDLRSLFEQGARAFSEGRVAEAIGAFQRVVVAAPQHEASWINLGVCWRLQKKPELAMACYRRILAFKPDSSGALSNLGNALKDLERFDEAIAAHRRAVALDPDSATGWHNFGVCLREAGDTHGALDAFDRALALNPDHVDAHWDRSLSNLVLGNYRAAWPDYEYRWRVKDMTKAFKPPYPIWNGEPLQGRSVLLFAEQGFGDTLMALRCLPHLKGHGGRIILYLQPEMRRLLGRLPNVDQLVTRDQPVPKADLCLPLMNLVALFTPDPASVAPPVELTVPADAGQRALATIARFKATLRVGIVWSGSVTFRNNHRRAVGLRRFLRFAEIPGVQLFSLQKGPPYEEFRRLAPVPVVIDLGSLFDDFADTAAALRQLDLVIMTDSSVAHLCGSLGVPVWNLLNFHSYWIYGSSGDTTPWYPTMRLFRQPAPSDWDWVFDRAHQALEVAVATKRAAGG
jgi:regulator of sirC expression with transglutaminase-like and TPR domain